MDRGGPAVQFYFLDEPPSYKFIFGEKGQGVISKRLNAT